MRLRNGGRKNADIIITGLYVQSAEAVTLFSDITR